VVGAAGEEPGIVISRDLRSIDPVPWIGHST
jgi:hypothetical protein